MFPMLRVVEGEGEMILVVVVVFWAEGRRAGGFDVIPRDPATVSPLMIVVGEGARLSREASFFGWNFDFGNETK